MISPADIAVMASAVLLGGVLVHLGNGIAGVLAGIAVLVLGLWGNSIEGPGGESGGGDF